MARKIWIVEGDYSHKGYYGHPWETVTYCDSEEEAILAAKEYEEHEKGIHFRHRELFKALCI